MISHKHLSTRDSNNLTLKLPGHNTQWHINDYIFKSFKTFPRRCNIFHTYIAAYNVTNVTILCICESYGVQD